MKVHQALKLQVNDILAREDFDTQLVHLFVIREVVLDSREPPEYILESLATGVVNVVFWMWLVEQPWRNDQWSKVYVEK